MRALAKFGLVVVCVVGPLGMTMPFVNIIATPIAGVAALPVLWYVLFTLPAERAEEYAILRQLTIGADTRRIS